MRWVPNALTLSRLLASPVLAWLLLQHKFHWGLLLVAFAGLTDGLDGLTARTFNATSKLGIILDPLSDKTLLVTLFLALGVLGLVPLWMLGLAIGRDLIIVVGSLLLRIFRNRRRFIPTIVGKISTFFQIAYVLLVLIRAAVPFRIWMLWLDRTALVLTALFTLISGLDYIHKGIVMTRQPPVPNEEYAISTHQS